MATFAWMLNPAMTAAGSSARAYSGRRGRVVRRGVQVHQEAPPLGSDSHPSEGTVLCAGPPDALLARVAGRRGRTIEPSSRPELAAALRACPPVQPRLVVRRRRRLDARQDPAARCAREAHGRDRVVEAHVVDPGECVLSDAGQHDDVVPLRPPSSGPRAAEVAAEEREARHPIGLEGEVDGVRHAVQVNHTDDLHPVGARRGRRQTGGLTAISVGFGAARGWRLLGRRRTPDERKQRTAGEERRREALEAALHAGQLATRVPGARRSRALRCRTNARTSGGGDITPYPRLEDVVREGETLLPDHPPLSRRATNGNWSVSMNTSLYYRAAMLAASATRRA